MSAEIVAVNISDNFISRQKVALIITQFHIVAIKPFEKNRRVKLALKFQICYNH